MASLRSVGSGCRKPLWNDTWQPFFASAGSYRLKCTVTDFRRIPFDSSFNPFAGTPSPSGAKPRNIHPEYGNPHLSGGPRCRTARRGPHPGPTEHLKFHRLQPGGSDGNTPDRGESVFLRRVYRDGADHRTPQRDARGRSRRQRFRRICSLLQSTTSGSRHRHRSRERPSRSDRRFREHFPTIPRRTRSPLTLTQPAMLQMDALAASGQTVTVQNRYRTLQQDQPLAESDAGFRTGWILFRAEPGEYQIVVRGAGAYRFRLLMP